MNKIPTDLLILSWIYAVVLAGALYYITRWNIIGWRFFIQAVRKNGAKNAILNHYNPFKWKIIKMKIFQEYDGAMVIYKRRTFFMIFAAVMALVFVLRCWLLKVS